MVVRYDFLWPDEKRRGLDAGKDRPACVILVVNRPGIPDSPEVGVVPITHRPPDPGAFAIELPADEKRRLGLDDAPSWIVLDRANRDDWPKGLTRTGETAGGNVYGLLSAPLGRRLAALLREAARARHIVIVPRF